MGVYTPKSALGLAIVVVLFSTTLMAQEKTTKPGPASLEFERIKTGEDFGIARARVTGGWLVVGEDNQSSVFGMTFVPDALQRWQANTAEQAASPKATFGDVDIQVIPGAGQIIMKGHENDINRIKGLVKEIKLANPMPTKKPNPKESKTGRWGVQGSACVDEQRQFGIEVQPARCRWMGSARRDSTKPASGL